MNLTRFSDYALRVMLCAGSHPERLLTIADIARTYDISENHLMKVVHRLAQLGLLETVRGKGGGLRLAHDPKDINLGWTLRRTEQGQPLVECFEGGRGECRIAPACALKTVLQEAEHAFFQVLDSYTLADMLMNRQALGRLLPLD
jgi:Rrf2 family transcriptional regulator, nitric oxide-sensitive transcriptional repressor